MSQDERQEEEKQEWVRIPDAAHMLGISRVRVTQLIAKGKLLGRQDEHGKTWVSKNSLLARMTLTTESSSSDPVSLTNMLAKVQEFHKVNKFAIGTGTRQDLLLRVTLLLEELGELASVVTKSPPGNEHGFEVTDWEHLKEEWTDILYLLLGTAIEVGWSSEEVSAMFHRVHHKNMSRLPRHTTLARTPTEPPSAE